MTTAGAVISWSYRHLSAPLADVFRDLGVHPGPDVSLAAVASLSGRPAAEAQAALRQLVDASLVAEQVPAGTPSMICCGRSPPPARRPGTYRDSRRRRTPPA